MSTLLSMDERLMAFVDSFRGKQDFGLGTMNHIAVGISSLLREATQTGEYEFAEYVGNVYDYEIGTITFLVYCRDKSSTRIITFVVP